MEKDTAVGVYKILSKDEEIIFESKTMTPVIFVKEAYIKKVLGREERREIPLSFMYTKSFLTSKRLLFLVFRQFYSRDFNSDEQHFAGVEGTWIEVPVQAISEYQIRPLIVKEKMWKGYVDAIEEIQMQLGHLESTLEIIYDESAASGRSLEYTEAMMKRGRFSKMLGKTTKISDKIIIIGNDAVSLAPSLKQFTYADKDNAIKEEGFFCTKCGAKQQEQDARFCNKCGVGLQPTIEQA